MSGNLYVLEDEQNLIGFEYNNVNTIDDLTSKFKKVLFDKIDKKDFEDIVPYYLQLSQAERNIKDAWFENWKCWYYIFVWIK